MPHSQFKKLLINDEACSNELFKYEDTYFNVNKYPISGFIRTIWESWLVKVNDIMNLGKQHTKNT